MDSFKKIIFIACAMFVTTHVQAATKNTEFSADAVISVPQQPIKQTKLYVSDKAVRRESSVNGQTIVEIVYPEEGRAVLINSGLRSYKQRMFQGESQGQNKKQNDNNPCVQIINATCEMLGAESIDGIKTEKWQIISNDQGKRLRTLHWIDVKRKLAIREFFPDGTVAELKMVKKEKINNRNTEKWQRTLSRPDGEMVKSYQWYDTDLKIAIREELPGGFIRELKNIKISKQPDKLFQVPGDYMKVENQPASIHQNMHQQNMYQQNINR